MQPQWCSSFKLINKLPLRLAWDKRWETPQSGVPFFKFKSNNMIEFENYYLWLKELLESEMHPFRPQFHHCLPLKDVSNALRNFLKKVSPSENWNHKP